MSGSTANSHRKYNPDPLMPVSLKLPESVIAKMDRLRGQQTRTAYILDAVQDSIRQDMVDHIEAMKAKVERGI